MGAINVIGLDHVVLRVQDIATSLKWYKSVLGCIEERVVPQLGLYQLRLGVALIDLVPVNGSLGKMGGGPPTKKRRNMDHFAIQLLSFDEKKIGEINSSWNHLILDKNTPNSSIDICHWTLGGPWFKEQREPLGILDSEWFKARDDSIELWD